MRAAVRKDLHDEDAAAYRWTDAVLDRHIGRAVTEYSIAAPLEQKTTIAATPGSRDISVAGLANLVTLDAIEYPTLQFPPSRVGFSLWSTTVTLDLVAAPTAADNVFFFWTTTHTLGASSTIPPMHDELIAEGAAGYAALDWTSYASNRVNVGGEGAWARYSAFANERLQRFRADLARLGRKNAVRQRRMYATDEPTTFEQGRLKY
jgi:hypothetical protein